MTRRHRLLIVDDEENILKALKRLFLDDEYEILTASNAEEALGNLSGKEISLVISDQRMPGMQGVELLTEIKKLSPHTMGILLTGTADLRTAIDAINSGSVYRYIAKPWNDEECKIIVRKVLEIYDIEQENRRLEKRIRKQNKVLKELNQNLKRAKELLAISFQRYTGSHLLDRILESSAPVSLSVEKKEVTILMSDIRGFTSISENVPPEQLVTLLNQYFEAMVEIIFKNDGFLDKFMGDAVMALFGAIQAQPDDALRAVKTAMEMQEKLSELNRSWVRLNMPEIKIGIGIATGEVVVGNIGSEQRMEFTVIGQEVNYAQRIEGLTKTLPSSILISEPTYSKVNGNVSAIRYSPIEIKGKKEPIVVYGVQPSH